MKRIISVMLTVVMLFAIGVPAHAKATNIKLHVTSEQQALIESVVVVLSGGETVVLEPQGNHYTNKDGATFISSDVDYFLINEVPHYTPDDISEGVEASGTINYDLLRLISKHRVTIDSDNDTYGYETATWTGEGDYYTTGPAINLTFEAKDGYEIDYVEEAVLGELGTIEAYQIPAEIDRDWDFYIHTVKKMYDVKVIVIDAGTATVVSGEGSAEYLSDPVEDVVVVPFEDYRIIDVKVQEGGGALTDLSFDDLEFRDDFGPITDNLVYFVYTEFVPAPEISLTKSVDPEIAKLGDTVTYSFIATNTGNVALGNVVLSDPDIGYYDNFGPLAVDASMTFTKDYVLTSPGEFVNEAMALAYEQYIYVEGDEEEGLPETLVYDEAHASVYANTTGLAVEKFAVLTPSYDGIKITEPILMGTPYWYYIRVSNTSDGVDFMVDLEDSAFSGFNPERVLIPYGDYRDFTIGGADGVVRDYPGTFNNEVIATGFEYYNGEGTSQVASEVAKDDESVQVYAEPSIEVIKKAYYAGDKTPVGDNFIAIGEEIIYGFTITNTGDMSLTEITLDDLMFGDWDPEIPDLDTMASGNDYMATIYSDVMSFSQPGVVDNAVTVTGRAYLIEQYLSDELVSDDDMASVVIKSMPAILLVKEAIDRVYVGTEVTYKFTLENTGDVDLKDIDFEDLMFPGLEAPMEMLAAGSEPVVFYSDPILLDEVGNVENHARVTAEEDVTPYGQEYEQKQVVDDADETVVVMEESVEEIPSIAISKTVDDNTVRTGVTVTYTFRIENNGDLSFDSVLFDDDMFDITDLDVVAMLDPDDQSFDPGDVVVFTRSTSFNTEGYKPNTANVDAFMYGEYEGSEIAEADASASSTAAVTVDNPTIRTKKYDLTITISPDLSEALGGPVGTIGGRGDFTRNNLAGTFNLGELLVADGWAFDGFFSDDDDAEAIVENPDGSYSIQMNEDREIELVFSKIPEAGGDVLLDVTVVGKGNIQSFKQDYKLGSLHKFKDLEGLVEMLMETNEVGEEFEVAREWYLESIGGEDGEDLILVDSKNFNLVMNGNKKITIVFTYDDFIDDEPLPQTGGVPMATSGLIGTMVAGFGFYLRKKRH